MNTNQNTCTAKNRFDRLCRVYDNAVEMKDYYKSVGDMDSFWRYMKICINLLNKRINYTQK